MLGIAAESAQHFGVLFESFAQDGVSGFPISFDVDQQRDLRPAGIDAPAVFLHPLAQGIEIEFFESAFRLDLAAHVRDEQLAIDEINVGFNAAKAVIERIEQWAFVLVIVVGMEAGQGLRLVLRRNGAAKDQQGAEPARNP